MRLQLCIALMPLVACVGPPEFLACELADEASIVAPVEGALWQPGGIEQFRAQAPSDEKTRPRENEFEVWLTDRVNPIIKVWGARTFSANDQAHASVRGGSFEPGFEELHAWRSYAVRTRSRHSEHDCDFGEWSAFRNFRIDDGSQALFDDSVIGDIELVIPPESWIQIDAQAVPNTVPYLRNYYPGTIRYDGEVFEDAGMRVKGGWGSARHLDKKASFKINLSYYGLEEDCPTPRRIRGLKRLTLNNQVQDGSFLRERLSYRLYDLVGVPSLRRAPIRVRVNDEPWGLYLHVETVDRRFLQRRDTQTVPNGMLYEGTYRCDIVPSNMPEEEGPATCFSMKFNQDCSVPDPGGDPYNYAPLRKLSQQIADFPMGDFYPGIYEVFDFDRYLSLWAADTISSNWDGAVYGDINNYRLYHDPTADLWSIIPSGVDQTFVKPSTGERQVKLWEPGSILAKRCLQEADCEAALAIKLREVLAFYHNEDFVALATRIANQVRNEVYADPRKEVTNEEFEAEVSATIEYMEERSATIDGWLRERGY